MADGIPIQCGDCGAHFQIDPAGDVQGAACMECGGKRFFRDQPSPTQSDGTLRNMVDSDTQKDMGGNPLGEGTIMGTDGERPANKRDNYMHSKVAMPREKYNLDPEWQPELQLTRRNPQDIYDQQRGVLEGFERWVPPANQPDADPPGSWQMKFRDNAEPNPNGTWTPTDEIGTSYIDPASLQGYKLLKGKLPQTPPELQGQFRQLEEGEPAIEGRETVGTRKLQRVEPMNTLNMEPYEPLWHESYVPKTAGPALLALPELGEAAAGAAGAGAAAGGGGGISGMLPQALPTLMRGALGLGQGTGQQSGSEAPEAPAPAPSTETISKTIPFLLVADLETPHSIKSVDEQHDDPEQQDQKEFNVGDKSPSNLKNPNNEDSGVSGEDGVRQDTPGYGFGPDSPGVERAMMILPLLLHYFQSDESGESDPLIRALHDALEQENPDYLKNEHPDGANSVEMIMQQHKTPHGVHAGVNAFPSGLSAQPGAGFDQQTQQQQCPVCGAPLTADGFCPNCGAKAHPQGGQLGTGGTSQNLLTPQPSRPPNAFTGKVGTSGAGPQTDEQKDAVRQLLRQQGRIAEIPMVDTEPWRFHKELNQIQNNPNVAPLVDPSQAQPSPAPMGGMGGPGMPGAPGGMPVMDPSQMGGGGGMPMQPMSKKAGPNHLPQTTQDLHQYHPNDYSEGGGTCPRCKQQSMSQYAGGCKNCGYSVGMDSPEVGIPGYDPHGAYTGDQMNVIPEHLDSMWPRWGKNAADTVHYRCPQCGSGSVRIRPGSSEETTSGECASCGKLIDFGKNVDQERYKGAKVLLADVGNPSREDAADASNIHPDMGQDPSLTWQDQDGKPIEMGQTYDLYTSGIPEPDKVQVVAKKPDALELQLVGEFSNISSDVRIPITINPHDIRTGKYTLVRMGQGEDSPEQPMGGMPGLEQIPQSGPTTDEQANSYPNEGTLSHVAAEEFDDLCHKCGCDWITHTASSETSTMHECARCGSVWETKDEHDGFTANTDLGWLYDSSGKDDFWTGMERAANMRSVGGQSRNFSAALEKDERYQRIREVLSRNDRERNAKLAGRHFTPREQRDLINERGMARNADLLNLTNTHYDTHDGYDPRDPKGRANEMNAPDAHLFLGL